MSQSHNHKDMIKFTLCKYCNYKQLNVTVPVSEKINEKFTLYLLCDMIKN